MTAADRPSVTDNARADVDGFLDWLIRMDEPRNEDRRTVTLTQIIAKAAEVREAAVRAETTTATDEDATVEQVADALEHWDRGIDWRLAEQENLTRAAYLRGAEQLLGLLATARTRPTRTIYSVQAWEDADGIRASWVTGYGQYTHSRSDAEATLKHQERQHPSATFRLAQAEVTAWTEADR